MAHRASCAPFHTMHTKGVVMEGGGDRSSCCTLGSLLRHCGNAPPPRKTSDVLQILGPARHNGEHTQTHQDCGAFCLDSRFSQPLISCSWGDTSVCVWGGGRGAGVRSNLLDVFIHAMKWVKKKESWGCKLKSDCSSSQSERSPRQDLSALCDFSLLSNRCCCEMLQLIQH